MAEGGGEASSVGEEDASSLFTAVGMMSGTSMDGIDVAMIRTDGEGVVIPIMAKTTPYDEEFRTLLRTAMGKRRGEDGVAEIERKLTLLHADAAKDVIEHCGIEEKEKDEVIVGFHGQTTHHAPDEHETVQIGDGKLLSKLLGGVRVVYDLRMTDVKLGGGQGAPLVPVFHAALAKHLGMSLAVLNVGGVANVTMLTPAGDIEAAMDVGPGCALLDDWIAARTADTFDLDGKYSSKGRVHDEVITHFLAHSFFTKSGPKSLDRASLAEAALSGIEAEEIKGSGPFSIEDGAATLVECTAQAILLSASKFSKRRWIVCGGGRLNPTLMKRLSLLLQTTVDKAEEVGWDGDAMEAQAFAYLAVRSIKGLPLTFPVTTGTSIPLTGGRIVQSERL